MSLNFFLRGKTFVMIVMVALFAGLAWFSTDYDTRGAQGPTCVIKVYGKCYRDQEVRRLAQFYAVANDILFVDFAMSLFGEDRLDRDPTDFVTNLLVLRHEAKKLGIEPTAEEAKEAIRTAPIFAMQTWINDDILVDRVLAPRGLNKADLIQLGQDYLSWRKISDLLSAGNSAVPIEIEKAYVRDNQQFTASLAEFKREDFVGKVELTDEKIQTYYDEHQEDLLSDEKRGVTALKFSPPAETPEMTAEQKAEQKLAFNNRVNEIYANIAGDESKFADLAKKAKANPENKFEITIEEIAPFAEVSPPELLKDKNEILADIFNPSRSAQPGRSLTVPYPQEDGSYLILKINEVIEPVGLTLEESREQIKTALTAIQSNLLVNEAATEASSKMLEALEAGKPAAEAAKSAGVELKPLPPFSRTNPPAKIEAASQIVSVAMQTRPGSVSEVLPMPAGKGYQFLFVQKTELVESEEADSRKASLRVAANSDYRRTLFKAWFREQLKESGASRSGPVLPDEEEVPTGETEEG
ncbi:MAG: SurA N-terminal domain-containing protein [Verrucomicrobiae bacterium]|nr:SurA N-terminal domain-containing protein [Verrucomicrobiae bacterium]